jgi:hypothetical protein
VEIHQDGTVLDRGQVESVTDVGSILWLAHGGAATRRLILKQDGDNVRLLLAKEILG